VFHVETLLILLIVLSVVIWNCVLSVCIVKNFITVHIVFNRVLALIAIGFIFVRDVLIVSDASTS